MLKSCRNYMITQSMDMGATLILKLHLLDPDAFYFSVVLTKAFCSCRPTQFIDQIMALHGTHLETTTSHHPGQIGRAMTTDST